MAWVSRRLIRPPCASTGTVSLRTVRGGAFRARAHPRPVRRADTRPITQPARSRHARRRQTLRKASPPGTPGSERVAHGPAMDAACEPHPGERGGTADAHTGRPPGGSRPAGQGAARGTAARPCRPLELRPQPSPRPQAGEPALRSSPLEPPRFEGSTWAMRGGSGFHPLSKLCSVSLDSRGRRCATDKESRDRPEADGKAHPKQKMPAARLRAFSIVRSHAVACSDRTR